MTGNACCHSQFGASANAEMGACCHERRLVVRRSTNIQGQFYSLQTQRPRPWQHVRMQCSPRYCVDAGITKPPRCLGQRLEAIATNRQCLYLLLIFALQASQPKPGCLAAGVAPSGPSTSYAAAPMTRRVMISAPIVTLFATAAGQVHAALQPASIQLQLAPDQSKFDPTGTHSRTAQLIPL